MAVSRPLVDDRSRPPTSAAAARLRLLAISAGVVGVALLVVLVIGTS